MKRNTLNYIVDAITLLVMWGLLATGLLIKYVLPPGSGHWLALNGWNRHDWGEVHFWLAVSACVLMFVHVLLHWQWVCATTRRFFVSTEAEGHSSSKGARAAWGTGFVVVLTALTAGLLLAANAGVTEIEGGEDDHDRGRGSGAGRGKQVLRRDAADLTDTGGIRETPAGRRGASGRRQRKDESPRSHAEGEECEEHHGQGSGSGRGRGNVIRGSSTLEYVASLKGITVPELRKRLGLPENVPAHERIGRLAREFGFSVSDVRAIPEGG